MRTLGGAVARQVARASMAVVGLACSSVETAPTSSSSSASSTASASSSQTATGTAGAGTVGGAGGMGTGGSGSGGNASGPLCQALGGTCVLGTWAQCAPGFEPAPDIHADCMPPDAVRGYFCCVPAPASTCSDSPDMVDCFAGQCELCWAPSGAPTVLSCEAGRTCCGYVCLD